MYSRINVTLPDETLKLLDKFAPKGDRSSFVDEAIQNYIRQKKREQLRSQLKEGAISRYERDLNLANDWFAVEEEA